MSANRSESIRERAYLEEDESGEHDCGHDVASRKVAHSRGQCGVQRVVNQVSGQGVWDHGNGLNVGQSCARARVPAEMALTRVDLAQLVIGDGRNKDYRW